MSGSERAAMMEKTRTEKRHTSRLPLHCSYRMSVSENARAATVPHARLERRRCLSTGLPMLRRAVAAVASVAASQRLFGTGLWNRAVARAATMMTFEPSSGVTTETSPRSMARNRAIWPMRKVSAVAAGCQRRSMEGEASPRNQSGRTATAWPILVTKVRRHGPMPWLARRLKVMAIPE